MPVTGVRMVTADGEDPLSPGTGRDSAGIALLPNLVVVGARRVRPNDLIDPEAMPWGVPYGCVVRADTAVVVQMLRQDTRRSGAGVPTVTCLPLF